MTATVPSLCWTAVIDGAHVVGRAEYPDGMDENALTGQEKRDSKKSSLPRGKALPGDLAITMKGIGSATQKEKDNSPLAISRQGGKGSKVSSGYQSMMENKRHGDSRTQEER